MREKFIDQCIVEDELDLSESGGSVKAFYEGEEIGVIDIHKYKRAIKIQRLGVKSELRNRGVATFLMKYVIDWSERKKILGITVLPSTFACKETARYSNALCQEELVEFYKNLGLDEEKGGLLHKDYRRLKFINKDVFWD